MDVKFELNSNDRRKVLSSLALASILPVVVLGSGFVIYNESLNISGQNSAVITLNLNSDAPNSDATAGGFRGSQSISPPAKPIRTTQIIEKIKLLDQVIIPDGIEPAIKPLNNMIEPTRISPPEQLQPSVQPASLQRKPSSFTEDSMDVPLQATSCF